MSKIVNPVLTLEAGGSGMGISYYKAMMTCPRKVSLSIEEGRKDILTMEDNDPIINAADAGSVFHKLAELYHANRDPSEICVDASSIITNETMQEGIRMFSAYSKYHTRDFWGNVLDVELGFPGSHLDTCNNIRQPNSDCNCIVSQIKERILDVFGVELTARIDMVVEVTKESSKRIAGYLRHQLEPGTYLLDHKTKSRRSATYPMECLHSLQFHAYQMIYNLQFTEGSPKRCKGMLTNAVYRHKNMTEESFDVFFTPPPTIDQAEILVTFLQNAKLFGESNFPNITQCFGFNQVCKYLTNGKCSRR
jgi:hypothetical protein